MTEPKTGRCDKCFQPRPLFSFEYVPQGFMEFVEIEVCTPCYSALALVDEDGAAPFIENAQERAKRAARAARFPAA